MLEVEGVCKDKCMLSYCCTFSSYILFNLICNIAIFSKKMFWTFDSTQGSRVRVRQNFCLSVVVHFIPFYLFMQLDSTWPYSWKLILTRLKGTMTPEWYATLHHLKMHLSTKTVIPTSYNIADMVDRIILETSSGVKVNFRETWKWYATLIPRCIQTSNLWFLPQII